MPIGELTVLLTRPLEDSRTLAETLEADDINPLIWPLTRIVPAGTESTGKALKLTNSDAA